MAPRLGGDEPLRVTQRAKFHRLCFHRPMSLEIEPVRFDVVRDTIHQQRHMVEQLVSRKDLILVDRHPRHDAIEPPAHHVGARLPQFGCEERGEARGCVACGRPRTAGVHRCPFWHEVDSTCWLTE